MYYHLTRSSDGIEVLMVSIFDKSDKATIKKDEALKQLKIVLTEVK